MIDLDEAIWFQKYRPKTIDDCILPQRIKKTFKGFIEKGEIPNLILSGSSGVGKTTIAKALLDEMGYDVLFINASLQRNIDVLRNDITQYASSVSFSGKRKFVILDEADALNPLTQSALRAFMEEFSKNCGFILTVNYINKIMDPIIGRCSVIDFNIPNDEKNELIKATSIAMARILKNENVDFDKTSLVTIVKNLYPNIRKIVNELQKNSVSGKIDLNSILNLKEKAIDELFEILRNKKYNDVVQWITINSDIEFALLCETIFNESKKKLLGKCLPAVIMVLNKYDYQNYFVANKEINMIACMTELMSNMEFKNG